MIRLEKVNLDYYNIQEENGLGGIRNIHKNGFRAYDILGLVELLIKSVITSKNNEIYTYDEETLAGFCEEVAENCNIFETEFKEVGTDSGDDTVYEMLFNDTLGDSDEYSFVVIAHLRTIVVESALDLLLKKSGLIVKED